MTQKKAPEKRFPRLVDVGKGNVYRLDDKTRRCVGCGCTDQYACENGCEWVGNELCSTCQTLGKTAKTKREFWLMRPLNRKKLLAFATFDELFEWIEGPGAREFDDNLEFPQAVISHAEYTALPVFKGF